MTTGLGCKLRGNNWGNRRIHYEENGVLIVVYVCEVCGQGKTDYQLFKAICYRGISYGAQQSAMPAHAVA